MRSVDRETRQDSEGRAQQDDGYGPCCALAREFWAAADASTEVTGRCFRIDHSAPCQDRSDRRPGAQGTEPVRPNQIGDDPSPKVKSRRREEGDPRDMSSEGRLHVELPYGLTKLLMKEPTRDRTEDKTDEFGNQSSALDGFTSQPLQAEHDWGPVADGPGPTVTSAGGKATERVAGRSKSREMDSACYSMTGMCCPPCKLTGQSAQGGPEPTARDSDSQPEDSALEFRTPQKRR